MNKKIINCTPHDITVILSDGKEEVFPSSGNVIRLDYDSSYHGEMVNGIPLVEKTYLKINGIPENDKDSVFIVSSVVLQAVLTSGNYPQGKFVAPATGDKDGCIRNDKGHITAIKYFNY